MVVVIINYLINKYFLNSKFKICNDKFCNKGNHCILFHMKECNIPFEHFGYVKDQTDNQIKDHNFQIVKVTKNESPMVIKQ